VPGNGEVALSPGDDRWIASLRGVRRNQNPPQHLDTTDGGWRAKGSIF
jgi:hypothetical protein